MNAVGIFDCASWILGSAEEVIRCEKVWVWQKVQYLGVTWYFMDDGES